MGKHAPDRYPDNDEITARLQRYLKTRAKDLACPICRTYQWHVAGIAELDGGNRDEDGDEVVMPAIVTICKQCSYIRHFAWVHVKTETDNG